MQFIDINMPHIIEARKDHIAKLTPLIFNRVLKLEKDNTKIKKFLTEEVIENILVSSPKKCYQYCLLFLRRVIENFKLRDWEEFKKINKTTHFSVEEQRLKSIFDDTYNVIKKIFDYEAFSRKETLYSTYNLAEKLDIPTCIYCNRIYTKTVIDNNGTKITRPTFDHWFPQSKYPLLALSFYNLIPSCTVCNSGAKGSTIFTLSTHFHPYFKDDTNEFKYTFSYDHKDYNKFSFKILTENEFSKRSIEAFELQSIFEAHEDELEDLRRIKDTYSEHYIEMLEKNILGVGLDREEVYRLAFGVHFQETKFDRRPLSKMKKDILIELGIIRNYEF